MKPKYAQNRRRKPVVPTKYSTKGAGSQLPKQLKYFHCGYNDHTVDNYFALHPKERRSSYPKNALEAKVGALKENFKNLASSGQILNVSFSFGTQSWLEEVWTALGEPPGLGPYVALDCYEISI